MDYAIDSAYLAVADLDACRPYERLGLRLSPAGQGRRTLSVGQGANLFTLHFLSAADSDGPLAQPLGQALAAARSLFAVGLRVADLEATLGRLETKGLRATRDHCGGDDLAWLPLQDKAGTDLVLVQTGAEKAALPGHAFPLKRLDHLAVVAHDLDARTRFWVDVLGVPVAGEVVTPTLVIRQLRLGDAVLELLGPASPDSPLGQRPAGLVGMASWEVPSVEEAVRQARAAGFTVADPAAGPLPGTRIATLPGSELAGVNMQLLEYA